MKNIRLFYLKIYIFLVVKFSVYLNRLVFVLIIPGGRFFLTLCKVHFQFKGNMIYFIFIISLADIIMISANSVDLD